MTVGITFLCSGGGGNLKLLHSLGRCGALPSVLVSGVIADRECGALEWARSNAIPTRMLAYTRLQPEALRGALADFAPDVVITTVHKILDDKLVAEYDGRLVNLHYSLLPAFAGIIGMEAVRRARQHGCRLVGATAHRVTAELDGGPILAQACAADDLQQAEKTLHDAVFRCGGVALVAALEGVVSPHSSQRGGLLKAGDLPVFAAPLPRAPVCAVMRDHAFWEALR